MQPGQQPRKVYPKPITSRLAPPTYHLSLITYYYWSLATPWVDVPVPMCYKVPMLM
jgi:hypothetical protein